MLKTHDNNKLDVPELTRVAACNEEGFIAILPLSVFYIYISRNRLHVTNRDGSNQNLVYANPSELSADFDALRTRMLVVANHCNMLTWEYDRFGDSPVFAVINPTDITGLQTRPYTDGIMLTLETKSCHLNYCTSPAAVQDLREAILNSLFS
jgi:hypothetical protein